MPLRALATLIYTAIPKLVIVWIDGQGKRRRCIQKSWLEVDIHPEALSEDWLQISSKPERQTKGETSKREHPSLTVSDYLKLHTHSHPPTAFPYFVSALLSFHLACSLSHTQRWSFYNRSQMMQSIVIERLTNRCTRGATLLHWLLRLIDQIVKFSDER